MYFLACDIGASSGRHILGTKTRDGKISLTELYRFENESISKNGHLCWDIEALTYHMIEGLKAARPYKPVSFGVDTWAVDYVLLDKDNRIIDDVVSYRDQRTRGLDRVLEARLPFEEHYRLAGIAKQPFNTVYQLMSLSKDRLGMATSFLMIPDYLHFVLTGQKCNEYSNASSTAMLNAKTHTWDKDILHAAGLPCSLFSTPPYLPGTRLGAFLPAIVEEIGYQCEVVLPATHDTASAFVAVPSKDEHAVYLSSGTWSLLGVELNSPLTSDASRLAGFTNEGGYGGKIRYLKNIMGLWILQCVRKEQGKRYSFAEMADMAQQHIGFRSYFDANDSRFLAPNNMINEIVSALKAANQPVPSNDGELFACVNHSLAICYRDAIRELEGITGKQYTSMNIVGGGSNSKLLNQLTADALGVPVYAGPSEGTALGNIVVQMLACGVFPDLNAARIAISNSFDVQAFYPKMKGE